MPKKYVNLYECCSCGAIIVLKRKKHKIAEECPECGVITTHFRIDTRNEVTEW